jgi:hypothetical protein
VIVNQLFSEIMRWWLSSIIVIYLKFKKLRFYVGFSYLTRFFRWEMQRNLHGRGILKKLYSLLIVTDVINESAFNEFLDVYPEKLAWITFLSDGGRVQGFDVDNRRIVKFIDINSADEEQLDREMCFRSLLPNHVPECHLLKYSSRMLINEDWIEGAHQAASVAGLQAILRILRLYLYEVNHIPRDDYIKSYLNDYNTGEVKQFLKDLDLIGWHSIPISKIHGDLVSQNVIYTDTQEFFLFDWEYCRTDIIFYDAWLYIYDLHGQERMTSDVDFYRDFELVINVFNISVHDIRALHRLLKFLRRPYI